MEFPIIDLILDDSLLICSAIMNMSIYIMGLELFPPPQRHCTLSCSFVAIHCQVTGARILVSRTKVYQGRLNSLNDVDAWCRSSECKASIEAPSPCWESFVQCRASWLRRTKHNRAWCVECLSSFIARCSSFHASVQLYIHSSIDVQLISN